MSEKRNKIIVIEDNPEHLMALAIKLRAHGFEIVSASDGGDGHDRGQSGKTRCRHSGSGSARRRRICGAATHALFGSYGGLAGGGGDRASGPDQPGLGLGARGGRVLAKTGKNRGIAGGAAPSPEPDRTGRGFCRLT